MQETTVIRSIDGRLAWYPPGGAGQPQWLDNEQAREAFAAAWAGQRPALCFAAPGTAVRLRELQIAPEERRHLRKSLPYMLEEELASDVDQLHFATVELDRQRFGVALCEHARMVRWQQQLEELPLVTLWVPEPMLLPWHEGEWCLVLEGRQGVLRTGACTGLSIERELLPAVLDAALQEHGSPELLVLYGQDMDADIALLPAPLGERVQWRRGGFDSALMVGGAVEPVLNLCQGEFARRLPLGRWWRQWRVAAALFAVAFGLQLAATYADYRQLQQENLALRAAVEDSYRSAFPRGALVDPEKQLQRQLESLRGSGQSSGFVSLVDRVGEVLAKQRGTSIASINYNDRSGEMRLNIEARNFEAVEAIRQGINRRGLDAEMESSSARGEGVRARIRVGGRS